MEVIVCVYNDKADELMRQMEERYFAHIESSKEICSIGELYRKYRDPDKAEDRFW